MYVIRLDLVGIKILFFKTFYYKMIVDIDAEDNFIAAELLPNGNFAIYFSYTKYLAKADSGGFRNLNAFP